MSQARSLFYKSILDTIYHSFLYSMTYHMRIAVLLLLSNYLFFQVHTIEPESLWKAIKKTLSLEKIEKRECTKIILYNIASERYVLKGSISEDFITINIDQETHFVTEELLEKVQVTTNHTINKSIHRRILHCLLAVSLVNTSQEIKEMEGMTPMEMQERKFVYSMELTKLLQFKSPVNQRSLVLVRYGESYLEFGQCRKSIYQRYPRRLVPIWEQVLFDFFHNTLAVHATTKDEKVVQMRKEEGNLLWMCEDIIEKIQAEENCNANMTKECKTKMDKGEFSAVMFNISSCKGYTPRM